ncbi:MAG: tRNA threonylcarbamoyladenosine dehydratase [Lachnospiraceae bacterium]|nr:tRNA threonylcarbamoyladenosine dehydratase [Lachnospiraceae bacterium]
MELYERTQRLLGEEAVEKLKKSKVAVFGAGGVGGFAIEALARAGIGYLALFDHDTISQSNLNRQIIALQSTIGQSKVQMFKKRIKDINPDCQVEANEVFFLPDTASDFDFCQYDYIVDAIDTVSGKIALICKAAEEKVPVISCMGAGNKLDATAFEVTDIYKTSVCPLAKVMRKELKARGIRKCKVVYSKETPQKHREPGSVSFVPSVAGLILAGEVVKDLIK